MPAPKPPLPWAALTVLPAWSWLSCPSGLLPLTLSLHAWYFLCPGDGLCHSPLPCSSDSGLWLCWRSLPATSLPSPCPSLPPLPPPHVLWPFSRARL